MDNYTLDPVVYNLIFLPEYILYFTFHCSIGLMNYSISSLEIPWQCVRRTQEYQNKKNWWRRQNTYHIPMESFICQFAGNHFQIWCEQLDFIAISIAAFLSAIICLSSCIEFVQWEIGFACFCALNRLVAFRFIVRINSFWSNGVHCLRHCPQPNVSHIKQALWWIFYRHDGA